MSARALNDEVTAGCPAPQIDSCALCHHLAAFASSDSGNAARTDDPLSTEMLLGLYGCKADGRVYARLIAADWLSLLALSVGGFGFPSPARMPSLAMWAKRQSYVVRSQPSSCNAFSTASLRIAFTSSGLRSFCLSYTIDCSAFSMATSSAAARFIASRGKWVRSDRHWNPGPPISRMRAGDRRRK